MAPEAMSATKGMSVVAWRAMRAKKGVVARATPESSPARRETRRPTATAVSTHASTASSAPGRRTAHSAWMEIPLGVGGDGSEPGGSPHWFTPAAPMAAAESHSGRAGLEKNQADSHQGWSQSSRTSIWRATSA